MHTQEWVGLVAYASCGHVRQEGTPTPGEDTHSWRLLLGVDTLHEIMLEGRVRSEDRKLGSTKTVYGWVITGTCKASGQVPRSHVVLKTEQVYLQTQDLLTVFWKVEDVSSDANLRPKKSKPLWIISRILIHDKRMAGN